MNECTIIDAGARFITGVGFPVAVASYLIIRNNGQLVKLAGAVERLAERLGQ